MFELSAPNFYCCNGRAVPWAFPLEFVCKYRVESRGTAFVQNELLTERKTRPIGSDLIFTLIAKAERLNKK